MVSYDDSVHLVLCCRKGDRRSLERLAQLIQERLRGYLRRMISNEDVAEDVLQEVLLAVVLRIKHLRSPERFWPWVVTIARNKVQDHFRKEHIRTHAENEFRLRTRHKARSRRGFQVHIEQREALRRIYLAKQKLSEMYAEVFELRCFKGISYPKIAGIIGCTRSNVYVCFHRARKLMCERFSSGMEEYF